MLKLFLFVQLSFVGFEVSLLRHRHLHPDGMNINNENCFNDGLRAVSRFNKFSYINSNQHEFLDVMHNLPSTRAPDAM